MTLIETFAHLGVIPIFNPKQPETVEPVCRALIRGGLPLVEVTFRTAGTVEAIFRIGRQFPEMVVGAGTVLTVEQAQQAVEAGARFLVSPGLDPGLVEWCQAHTVLYFPGVATPSEIQTALRYGLNVLKFFPAEVLGGIRMLEALHGPFGQVKFIPTGGIGPNNAANYLRLPNVLAVGGSWMIKAEAISKGDFEEIAQLAQAAREIAIAARG